MVGCRALPADDARAAFTLPVSEAPRFPSPRARPRSTPRPARLQRVRGRCTAAVDPRFLRRERRKRWLRLSLGGLAGGLAILIAEQQFPPGPQTFLRCWGLHTFAVLGATVLTGSLLGCGTWSRELPGRLRLAWAAPSGLLGFHEIMQWLYPHGVRDNFDTVRDLALNALGTFLGWSILHWLGPAAPPAAGRVREAVAVAADSAGLPARNDTEGAPAE